MTTKKKALTANIALDGERLNAFSRPSRSHRSLFSPPTFSIPLEVYSKGGGKNERKKIRKEKIVVIFFTNLKLSI